MSPATPSGWLRAIAAALLLGTALSACSAHRPELADWEATWKALRTGLPDAQALSSPAPHAACEKLLVTTRRAREELLPTPDPALDAAVLQWIDAAGAIAFDCPGRPGQVDASLQELALIEAEVEASLARLHAERGTADGGEGPT